MTKKQQNELNAIHSELEAIKSRIETVQNEAQDAYDNKSEKWQEGEKGEAEKNKLDLLAEAVSSIDDIIGNIEEAKEE